MKLVKLCENTYKNAFTLKLYVFLSLDKTIFAEFLGFWAGFNEKSTQNRENFQFYNLNSGFYTYKTEFFVELYVFS